MVSNGAFTRTMGFGQDMTRNRPHFHMENVEDPVASQREGRPIFREEERVEIIMPGNPHTRPVMKVTDEHRQMWPEEYAAFKKGQEVSLNGTPLEEWPRLKRNQVMELKALGFATVEEISAMPDTACQRIGMGGMTLRTLAKAFLDDAERNALAEKLTAEASRKDAEIAELRDKVNQLSTLLNSVHGEMQAMRNAPNAVASHIPGMNDPVELAKRNPEDGGSSSLASLELPRRKGGRPPLPRDENGNIIREAV